MLRLRQVTLAQCEETLSIQPEDCLPEDLFGSPEDAAEVRARMNRGSWESDPWAWFWAGVIVRWGPFTGKASIGGLCYADETEFRSEVLPDLRAEALADLNAQIETADKAIDQLRTKPAPVKRAV